MELLEPPLVVSRRDMTIDDLQQELGRQGVGVGRSPIGRFLLARGPTLKKTPHATEQGNRVKKSCGDEACEEVVVPCSNLALEAK